MENDWKAAESFVMVLYVQPRTRKMAVDRDWESKYKEITA